MKIKLDKFTKSRFPYLSDSDVDKPIPVLYGTASAVELVCINPGQSKDSASVKAQYKLPEGTTSVGTLYLENNDTFIEATGVVADYVNGVVTVSNGRSTNGSTRKCKMVGGVGYIFSGHSYPSDVLKHIFSRFAGIEFTESNFNISEWNSELSSAKVQGDICVYIDEEVDLWQDIVYPISCNSRHRFRVWVDKGLITAKVKDYSRASSRSIASADIVNVDELPINTDRSKVYASVVVKYARNYYDDVFLSLENTTYKREVGSKYRTQEELEEETYIISEADAEYRAYEETNRTCYIQKTINLILFRNLDINIYDVITVSAMPDNLTQYSRLFAGNNDCLVLSVKPNRDNNTNTVRVAIIPNRIPLESQSAVRSGLYSTISREKSSLEIVQEVADNATVTFSSLASAQGGAKPGDLFTEAGITYRANYFTSSISLANSTRLTAVRYPDVADLDALNALTGMINYDTVYQTDTMQWYYYFNGWQTDGSAPLNGQYTSNIFAKNTSPNTPPALSQVDAPPGWYDAPPALDSDEYLWFSKSTWRDTTRLSNWTTPVRISGTLADLTTQYSIDGINWTTSTVDAVYMRISPDGGLTWGDSVRVKGEQGEQGASGSGLYVQITDPLETTASYQDGQLGTFAGYNYVWTATSPTVGYWTIMARTPVSSTSIHAFLSLDENSLTEFGDYMAIDNSGNDNHGYAKNAIIVSAFRGNGLQITARNQYINL